MQFSLSAFAYCYEELTTELKLWPTKYKIGNNYPYTNGYTGPLAAKCINKPDFIDFCMI